MEVIRQVQRVSWDHATSNVGDLSDPLMVSFGTLPARELFAQQLAAAQRSPNRLAEGGCENLPAMLAAGWKHYQHPQAGIRTSVDLSPTSAHAGAAGLLLQAAPAVEGKLPGVVETPPVWITSIDPTFVARAVREDKHLFVSGGDGGLEKLQQTRALIDRTAAAEGKDAGKVKVGLLRAAYASNDKAEVDRYLDCSRYQRRVALSMKRRTAQIADDNFAEDSPKPATGLTAAQAGAVYN
jgi:alkanesulfonate monooxygenase SsuD/methylene tetrahydromethanopterin reductase-like flavin-dependent oxidoreductase (luciferase family)